MKFPTEGWFRAEEIRHADICELLWTGVLSRNVRSSTHKTRVSPRLLTRCSPSRPIRLNLAVALPVLVAIGNGRTEVAVGMERACYLVEQFRSQWIVSVCGTKVLACKTKRTAVEAARRATVLLHQHRQGIPSAAARSAPEPWGQREACQT